MAVLVLCPAAFASEMQYTPESGPLDSSGETTPPELRYVADPGEDNLLIVMYDEGTYVFKDSGATIRPGPCTAVSANEVRCTGISRSGGGIRAMLDDGNDAFIVRAPVYALGVDMGAGEDTVDATALTDSVLPAFDGGPGDDIILGSPAGDLLFGGDGSDGLRGDQGADTLEGGGGSDSLDGGADTDTVTYRSTFPVTVNMSDFDPDGAAGENDTMRDIENVTTVGSSADVLIGNSSPNVLSAGGGANHVEGRGGNDRIVVGNGADEVFGGDGDDVIDANGASRFRRTKPTSCGAGSDLVRAPNSSDLLEPDCERVEFLYFLMSARPVALDTRRGVAAFRWSVECPRAYRCSGLLALRRGSTLLGQAYVRAGLKPRRFYVKLTRAGRAFARSGRTSRVQVSVRRDRRRTSGGRVGRGATRTYGIRGLAP